MNIISKTNEQYISKTYGCITFSDSYAFLSSSLDELVETLDIDAFNVLKKKFLIKWKI